MLTVDPMPDWTVAEILAVHFRMHKAEGVLFRDALVRASGKCGLKCVEVLEKQLDERAERILEDAARQPAEDAGLTREVGGPALGQGSEGRFTRGDDRPAAVTRGSRRARQVGCRLNREEER